MVFLLFWNIKGLSADLIDDLSLKSNLGISLIKKINGINYDFYGFENKEPIWGDNFYNALTNSKMGLNLSRGLPTKYYSSNRIASLIGNGLMTFIDKRTSLNEIFNSKEVVFYTSIDDLSAKIKFYKRKDSLRKQIARKGKNKYFKCL